MVNLYNVYENIEKSTDQTVISCFRLLNGKPFFLITPAPPRPLPSFNSPSS